jgi:hypothetical protein
VPQGLKEEGEMINLQVIDGGLEPDADEIALRHTLRREIEQHGAALSIRDRAKATVEAGVKHLADVETELKQYDDLDNGIAARRATIIAESLEAGGVPDLDTPELRDLIIKRAEASNRHAAFAMALEKLRGSLAEAERTLASRKHDVESAALSIVGHCVDQRARALREIEAQAAELRRQLLGATALRPGAQTPLRPETLALLRDDSASALVSKNTTSTAAVWNQLFARLRDDPEARIDD